MKRQRRIEGYGLLGLMTLMGFILLFTYLSLNLKTIDFGYEMQELLDNEQQLREEIDKLKSDKARLLNLERVERIVTQKLGYQYPDQGQFIKVFDGQEEGEKR
jgi:cell division protein FtsL